MGTMRMVTMGRVSLAVLEFIGREMLSMTVFMLVALMRGRMVAVSVGSRVMGRRRVVAVVRMVRGALVRRLMAVLRWRGRSFVVRRALVVGRRERSLVSRGRSLSVVRRRELSFGGSMARNTEWRSTVRLAVASVVSGELVSRGTARGTVRGTIEFFEMGTVAVKPLGAQVTGRVLDLFGKGVHNALNGIAIPERGESGRRRWGSAMVTTKATEALLDGHFLFMNALHQLFGLGVEELELLDLSLELVVEVGHLSILVALALGLVEGAVEIENESRGRLSESQEEFGRINSMAIDLIDGKAKKLGLGFHMCHDTREEPVSSNGLVADADIAGAGAMLIVAELLSVDAEIGFTTNILGFFDIDLEDLGDED